MRSENQVLYETIAALDMDEDKVYFLAVFLASQVVEASFLMVFFFRVLAATMLKHERWKQKR